MSIRIRKLKKKFSSKRMKYFQDQVGMQQQEPKSYITDKNKEEYFRQLDELIMNFNHCYKEKGLKDINDSLVRLNQLFVSPSFEDTGVIKGTNARISQLGSNKFMLSCLSGNNKDNTQLQRMVTWIYVNLSSEEFTPGGNNPLMNSGLLVTALELLEETEDSEVIVNIFWMLSNMVYDSVDVRDSLFQMKVVESTLKIAKRFDSFKAKEQEFIFTTMVSFMRNFCQIKPYLGFNSVVQFYLIAVNGVDKINQPDEALVDCLDVLRSASSHCETTKEEYELFDGNLFENLIYIIEDHKVYGDEPVSKCIEILSNMLSINLDNNSIPFVEEQIRKHKHLATIVSYMSSSNPAVLENVLIFLRNYLITDPEYAMEIIRDMDIVSKLISTVIMTGITDHKILGMSAVKNIFESLNPTQICKYFEEDNKILDTVMSMLNSAMQADLAVCCIKILSVFLKSSKDVQMNYDHEDDLIVKNVLSSEYLDRFEDMQSHRDEQVQKLMDDILEDHFATE